MTQKRILAAILTFLAFSFFIALKIGYDSNVIIRAMRMNYLLREPTVGEPTLGGKHIIFLETSCVLNETRRTNETGLILTKRQACSIESAAKMNPSTEVYLLYTCSIVGTFEDSVEYVKELFSYHNVRMWELNVSNFFDNTPLEDWNFLDKVKSSLWPRPHASDVLRYLSLWKYGGTYLDLDFVIIKSLDDLESNYAGAETPSQIGSGVINFGAQCVGRLFAQLCLADLKKNFKGHIWVQNGPAVITRVSQNICGTSNVSEMTREKCLGFKVMENDVFYPIFYGNWRYLFNNVTSSSTMSKVNKSHGVHVWNKLSENGTVYVGSVQPYALLAVKYCPHVYAKSGASF